MNIYYKSSSGQVLDFMDCPYKISESDLFDYEWEYENTERRTQKITNFKRGTTEKTVTISIVAGEYTQYLNSVSKLLEVVETDVLNLTPGRLYVDEEYLTCYIYKSHKKKWYPGVPFIVNIFSVVSETGLWVRESSYSFKSAEINTTNNKQYPHKYAHRYGNSLKDTSIINNHFADADFKLTIYGPALNPHVIIGNHRYLVHIYLEPGEYLSIDSREKAVKKTMNNGTIINAFQNRDKQVSVFRKIPPGRNSINWSGAFDFDITIYMERSEPMWR